MIPFNVTIPESERDPGLKEKLKAELPGILRWAVEGCLGWQKSGLGVPNEVKAATESYRAEMDNTAEFLKDCCVQEPSAKVRSSELFETYGAWCKETGEESLDPKTFSKRLIEKGFIRKRSTGGHYFLHGIGLVTAAAA
jgi:putative DNA primase/helicase